MARNVLKRLTTFIVGSAAAQGLTALTGILLAHWLTVPSYALYTIVTMITGAMTLLTKGGTHLGYTALLGRDWPNPDKVDAAGKAVKMVRRQVSAFILPPVTLVSVVLLIRNGGGTIATLELIALLLLSWRFDMQTRVVDQVLFFARQTSRVQLLDTALALVRIVLTSLLYMASCLTTVTAVLVTVGMAGLRVPPILRWIRFIVPSSDVRPSDADVTMIRTVAMRQMPVELFTVFQTQVILVVLSFFSVGANVANYGALSRIPQLLVPVQMFSYAFCIPIFVKQSTRIVRSLALMTVASFIPALCLIAAALVVPDLLLKLIGSHYAGLTKELQIAVLNAGLYSAASNFWNLIAHRGWNRFAWLQIAVGLAWCAASPAFLDLTHLSGVLWLQFGFTAGYVIAGMADLADARRRELL